MSGGGLRDLLESLGPRDGGSRRGRRTSPLSRAEIEVTERGYYLPAKGTESRRGLSVPVTERLTYRGSSGERQGASRPQRERPRITARQRRIRARRRRERAEAREARMARRSGRTGRPREEVVELAGMTITAPRPRVARRPMGGRRRRRG